MKELDKQHLQEVLRMGNVCAFRAELHNVIKEEVIAMDVPLDNRNKMLDMLKFLEIPLVVKPYIKHSQKNTKKQGGIAIIAASATGTFLNGLLHKVHFVPKTLLSFGGAVLVGLLVMSKNNKIKERSILVETIETPFEEIASKVDMLLSIIRGVITPPKINLSDSFSNVLKWYQQAYSSCDDFGADCSNYFRKRIENILEQCGYSLHNFNGDNANLFQKIVDAKVQKPVQNTPAITNEAGYILPGNLFVPESNKF